MNKQDVKNLVKKIYFAFWWRFQTLKSRLIKKNKNDKLAFVFVGRNESWSTLGRELYAKNDKFRQIIQECNSILLKLDSVEILSYFDEPVNDFFFDEDAKFFSISAIQVAIVDIANDNGIFPNAVIGVSMGEATAAYAAGVLTKWETMRILTSYVEISKLEERQYSLLALNLGYYKALKFCEESPIWVKVIYENSHSSVLITCESQYVTKLKNFAKTIDLSLRQVSEKTYMPYHTPLLKSQKEFHKSLLKEINLTPLKCDYYSPTLGKKIEKNTILDLDYWFNVISEPVQLNSAFKALLDDECRTFFQVGPPTLSDRQFNISSESNVNIVNSFNANVAELQNLESCFYILKKIKFESSLVPLSDSDFFSKYKESFNSYQINATKAFDFLRRHGEIHFLPQNGAWLILNYEAIDNVLRDPEIFSSSIIAEYDPILLGADPKVHKVIRGLLQPLFSPAVINELAEFTLIHAERILNKLFTQDEFDFVKDFSDPLSFTVLCNFFGLPAESANRMIDFTGKDYHKPIYWKKLESFFKEEFNTCELTREDCLWAELRKLSSENRFIISDAISLLKIVWTAGMATTSALISSSINYVLNEEEITNQLHTDDKLVSKFIEECLRLQPPLEAVFRITTQPIIICEQQIPINTTLLLHLKSGMLDPKQYLNPETFSISRPAKKHLAFGAGIHQCIGMGIARAEARSALSTVLKKIDEIRTYNFSEPEYVISDLKVMSSLKLSKLK